MSHKELIAQVKQIAESGVADYLNVGYQNSEILTKAADALESLTQQLAELQEKLEDALKDRVALATALDCGHRPPCEECKLHSPTAQQAQPEPSVPEGWKLVPIEPTEAMLEVGFFAEKDVFDSAKTKRIHVWKDMIAAAPQPKETK